MILRGLHPELTGALVCKSLGRAWVSKKFDELGDFLGIGVSFLDKKKESGA
jgi:hypothetical protein